MDNADELEKEKIELKEVDSGGQIQPVSSSSASNSKSKKRTFDDDLRELSERFWSKEHLESILKYVIPSALLTGLAFAAFFAVYAAFDFSGPDKELAKWSMGIAIVLAIFVSAFHKGMAARDPEGVSTEEAEFEWKKRYAPLFILILIAMFCLTFIVLKIGAILF